MKPAQTVSAMGVMSDHGAGAFGAAAARAFLKSEGTAGSGTFPTFATGRRLCALADCQLAQ